MEKIYAEVSAAYVYQREVFQKLNRRIGLNPYLCEVSEIEAADIDNPEDFLIADAIYRCILRKEA